MFWLKRPMQRPRKSCPREIAGRERKILATCRIELYRNRSKTNLPPFDPQKPTGTPPRALFGSSKFMPLPGLNR
jgi:hypothetical protein